MAIKTAIKEHFAHNSLKDHLGNSALKNHWCFKHDKADIKGFKQIYNNQGLSIREFRLDDLDGITELFATVFRADPWYDNWAYHQVRDYLMELIENPVFKGFIAFKGSDIAAVCLGHGRSWWMGKEFFIDEFFVENERQGNGIGSKTLDIIGNNLAEDGYTRLILLTNKEIPAEIFYLKNGFNNNHQRTVMVKNLQ